MFFIYINDLSDGLRCKPKLFADDTSLFFTLHNINKATSDLNNDLIKITQWDFQLKMSFNPEISEQALEFIFSRKRTISHPSLTFDDTPVLDKLYFEELLNKVIPKVNKTIGVIRKLQNVLPRPALLRICKSLSDPIYINVLLYTWNYNMKKNNM